MKSFLTIIKLDYLQRTRNYNFLITLCASLAIAYTFVPEPNANYSTIRISDYVGFYNSAWFGYVTAIMTSIFLSLIGFYLINSGIKNDVDTKVGQLIAASPIKNFNYLLSKFISNFLLLFTIVCVIFLMSITLFFLYNDGYNFELLQFLKPYGIVTIPALFFIAALGVLFEVILPKYTVLQNSIFFFLFCMLLVYTPNSESQFYMDAFGSKIVIDNIEREVRTLTKTNKNTSMNIGYVLGNTKKPKKFEFTGVDFSVTFIASRFLWMLLSVVIIAFISLFFHRFSIRRKISLKLLDKKEIGSTLVNDLNLSELVTTTTNFSILPLIKTEFLLLFRKGKKWLWIVNVIGMFLLAFLPLGQVHQLVLPILWFLQVHRFSDISTAEKTFNINLFVNTSYKPLQRIFMSKIVSVFLLFLVISSPLLIRYSIDFEVLKAISIVIGFMFIISLSTFLGLTTKGKKLFEVVFFLITYCNINTIPLFDYFGEFSINLTKLFTILSVILILLGFALYYKSKPEC